MKYTEDQVMLEAIGVDPTYVRKVTWVNDGVINSVRYDVHRPLSDADIEAMRRAREPLEIVRLKNEAALAQRRLAEAIARSEATR